MPSSSMKSISRVMAPMTRLTMKPGISLRTSAVFLPDACHEALGLLVRLVGARGAPMHLDQRDDVRGVEVVDADDFVGTRQPFGQRVHGHAAGVAADYQLGIRPPGWPPAAAA